MLETDQIETKNIINIKLMWKMFRSFWYDEEGDQNHVIRVFFFFPFLCMRGKELKKWSFMLACDQFHLSLLAPISQTKKKKS